MRRALPLCAAATALALASCAGGAARTDRPTAALAPPIRHVFIIVLENEEFEDSFGERSPAAYLKGLAAQGALLPNYYATSHASLGNYLSMISGQAPNPITNNDCEVFADFVGEGTAADGQAIGHGCVYPAKVGTIANQLNAAGLTWKGYMEDMGNNPRRESATCAHPPIGAADNTQLAEPGDQYATRHDPFVYFHSIIHTPQCAHNVVNLAALAADLRQAETTPNYAFITPNLCNDGHDGGGNARCVDGAPGGMVSADLFLREWVPRILASPAFQRDGLLVVTFDESEIEEVAEHGSTETTLKGDASHCCNEQPGPNIPAYQEGVEGSWERMNGPGIIGPGGGRIGAVLVSPFIQPGTVSMKPYNHYALLRSVEDLFGLGHLGFAGQQGLDPFGADVYTRPGGTKPALRP